MKRMSEVFELPINAGTFEVYGYIPVDGVRLADSLAADEHAAHAINHVDALNDALQNLMNMLGGAPKDCGHEFHCVCPYEKAAAALKAYRGEK
jgi:hypothetical protein